MKQLRNYFYIIYCVTTMGINNLTNSCGFFAKWKTLSYTNSHHESLFVCYCSYYILNIYINIYYTSTYTVANYVAVYVATMLLFTNPPQLTHYSIPNEL